jgi:hypothetical protein
LSCQAGSTSGAASSTCDACEAGTFNYEAGSESCSECPANETTDSPGATSCTCVDSFVRDPETSVCVSAAPPDDEDDTPTVRTVVEAEVKLAGMSKASWEDRGEDVFKESIASSVGCDPEDVSILSVKGGVEGRRVRRRLAVSALEVEFRYAPPSSMPGAAGTLLTPLAARSVDVTEVIGEKDVESLVQDVQEKVAGTGEGSLAADIAAETDEVITVEVVTAAKVLEVDAGAKAGVHDQSGSAEWYYDCVGNGEGGNSR